MLVVFHSISYLLALEGLLMALCGLASWYPLGDSRTAWLPLLLCGGGILVLALLLWLLTPTRREITRRDGMAIAAFGWLAACLLGAFPFLLSHVVPTYAAAFFEAASGLTTTGSTVIPVLEGVPRGILLWRAASHLLGGLGVLVLLVAILPLAGAGGSQIVHAESPASSDRVEPRMTSSAKALWATYLLLCAVLLLLLRAAGMGWFDATCHAFSAVSTGGFSTRTASIAAYPSPAIEAILTLFMLLSAINFSLHYRTLRGGGFPHLRHAETRFFLALLALGVAAIALILRFQAPAYAGASPLRLLRHAAFTATSLASTTGFGTTDYDTWPVAAKYILFTLFLVGGVAGSTAGGMKAGRILVLLKAIRVQVRLYLQPAAILHVRSGRKVLPSSRLLAVSAFVLLYLLTVFLSTLLLLPACPDLSTAVSSVAASLSNTGPGFAAVGPTCNYAFLPAPAQAFLAFLMVLGRLEILTVLVLLLPSFWRR